MGGFQNSLSSLIHPNLKLSSLSVLYSTSTSLIQYCLIIEDCEYVVSNRVPAHLLTHPEPNLYFLR